MLSKTLLSDFIDAASNRGWLIVGPNGDLPTPLVSRYNDLPADYRALMSAIDGCVSPDEKTWFVTPSAVKGSGAFRWNEFELMSMDAADGDDRWKDEIRTYWNEHIPVVMSVRSGYAYLAVNVASGDVVIGYEPAFEEGSVVYDSIAAMIEGFIANDQTWSTL